MIENSLFSGLQSADILFVIEGLYRTVLLTFLSVFAGTIIGCVLGWLRFESNYLRILLAPYVDVTRSIPLLIQFILINSALSTFGIPLEPFEVGLLTLSLYIGVLISELIRAGLGSVRSELKRASRSLGLNYWQSMIHINAPLAIRTVLPGYIGTIIGVTKDTALVSVVGYIELLRSIQILIIRTNEALLLLTIVGIIYFLICYPISHYSLELERRLKND